MDIFPRLPDEIGLQCLLRVPFQYHINLKMVSRKWKAIVSCPKFYEERKLLKMSEHRICFKTIPMLHSNDNPSEISLHDRILHSDKYPNEVFLYNPANNEWERLPPLPPGFELTSVVVFVSVAQQLFLIGGMDMDDTVVKSVFMYDICSCRWFRRKDMPTERAWFACSVSPRGLIYIAGGMDKNANPLPDAAVYDPNEDKWDLLSPMNTPKDSCSGAFIDNKFFVVSCSNPYINFSNAEVFDTDTKRWATVENLRGIGHIVPFHDRLYIFQGDGVMEYNCQENVSRLVEPLPSDVYGVVSATIYGDKIFVTAHQKGWDGTLVPSTFYVFVPPNSQGSVAQKWIPMQGGVVDELYSTTATALDI